MKTKLLVLFLPLILLGIAGKAFAGPERASLYLTATPTATLALSPTPTVSPTPTKTPEPTATPTQAPNSAVIPLIQGMPTPVGIGPENHPYYVNPLTGKIVTDLSRLDRRPMVVKITNYPRNVRPQSGLSRADVVYEYYMERGIARFIAVFYGEDAEKVGPVRSARLFDEHVFRMYDGVFIFGNADDRVMSYFLDMEIHIVNSFVLEDSKTSCKPDIKLVLCRDRSIISYNNMFTDTAYLQDYIRRRNGNYRPALPGMRFTQRVPPGGSLGLNVYVRYSLFMYAKWQYDLDSGRYYRFQESIGYSDINRESYLPHFDALTGEQLAADNVVVLDVPANYFIKTEGTEMINTSLWGSGQAWVFRDGFVFSAVWERPANGGIVQLFTLDGEPFPLKPGKTWYQVISQFSEWRVENGVDYRFIYYPPPEPFDPINPHADDPPFGPDYTAGN